MIREYRREDINQLISIISEGYLIDSKEIKQTFEDEGRTTFIYEDGTVKGFVTISERNKEIKEYSILIYVKPSERRRGIGSLLHNKASDYLREIKPNGLITKYRVDKDNPTEFYQKLGYKKWFGTHDMHYHGGRQPDSKLDAIPYDDQYFLQYAKGVDDCFAPMREANDIRPYHCFEPSEGNREDTLKRKDNIYLFLDNDKMIASVIVENGFLDDIFVIPEYQGRGYGKEITKFAINKALDNGADLIHLGVVEWNTKACNIYESLGFKRVQTIHFYRQFVDK